MGEPCPDSERTLKAKCNKEMEELEAQGLDTQNPTVEEKMTEKERGKATAKRQNDRPSGWTKFKRTRRRT